MIEKKSSGALLPLPKSFNTFDKFKQLVCFEWELFTLYGFDYLITSSCAYGHAFHILKL